LVLSKKGQVSIEFILLVAISLIYINAVIWPVVENSSQSAMDIKAVADTKLSAMKFGKALNEAAMSNGDMKKTISFFLPENSSIVCVSGAGGDRLEYSVLVDFMGSWDSAACTAENPGGLGFNPDELHCVVEDNPIACDRPLGFTCTSQIDLLAGAVPSSPCPVMNTGEGERVFRNLVVSKDSGSIEADWES